MVNNLKLIIKSNIKTFVSILLLTMLGVGFFVGMKGSVPNLEYTVQSYFDKYNIFDLQLVSSLGFNSQEVEEFSKIDGVKKIEGSYSKDFVIKGNKGDYVLRVHSYINQSDSINQLELIKGSLPTNVDEIVIEELLYKKQKYNIGDKITLNSNLLNNKELKIVGVIKSPLYLSSNKGTTNLLSGRVNYYAFVNYDNINSEVFSTIYIKTDKDVGEISNEIKKIGADILDKRYSETISTYKEKIETGQKEIDSKRKEAQDKISRYEAEIANAKQKIKSAEESLPTVEQAQKTLDNNKKELSKVKAKLDAAKSQIDAARAKYNKSKKEYDKYNKLLKEAKAEAKKNDASYVDYLEIFQLSLDYAKEDLDLAKEQLDEKQYEYDLTYAEYRKAEKLLNAKSAEEVIELAKKEIEEKKALLNKKATELESSKKKVEKEFEDYQNQLNDASDYLKLISVNGWKIETRDEIASYKQYLSDINRIQKIGNFFPVIFYIVTVLITLTNISRIIANERDTIGLYKALGYSNTDIGNDYIYFSALSCFIGSVLGSVIGLFIVPRIFYTIYKIIYYLPAFKLIVDFKTIIIAILLAMVLVVVSSYLSIKGTIKEWPAILFRPKENNKGKRVILERITFIWNHLNFTNKVTFRNMFKYPKRFIMTILGISGCISLIIAGFNIKTSISNIIPLQFGQLFDIDAEVFLKDSLTRSETRDENERISQLAEVDETILSYVKYVYLNDTETKVYLVVPEDSDLLLDFVTLKDGNKEYSLDDDGVLITRKISEVMNIRIGDTLKVKDTDNNIFNVKVSKIVDNYVDNYIYMSNNYYESVVKEVPKYNAILVRTANVDYQEQELSKKFNENSAISYLVYTSTSKTTYNTLTKSLNYIVYILVISAVLLAFVVLYNLNNLNVDERKREIATIKVLGFYKKETYKYIENEIKRLTVIGIIIGLFLGYIFSNILIKSCELDNLMYDYSIHYMNYLYAIVITVFFMIVTSLLGRKNISKINMIESLKKVE